MINIDIILPIAQAIGSSVLAGLAYSVSGYLNHWVAKRKENAEAPWDWKKMGATGSVAIVVGIIIGIAKYTTGTEVAIAYELIGAIGLNTLIKKWLSVLWYGKEQMLAKVTSFFKRD